MQTVTIEQLRAVNDAGGIVGVTLKGQGGAFLVHVATRNGADALLAKARSSEPRRFGNPLSAINLLRGIGITAGAFDAADWNPDEKEPAPGNRGRSDAMREAHRAAAYSKWLAGELQAAIDDPRPSLPHGDVMAQMDAEISRLAAGK